MLHVLHGSPSSAKTMRKATACDIRANKILQSFAIWLTILTQANCVPWTLSRISPVADSMKVHDGSTRLLLAAFPSSCKHSPSLTTHHKSWASTVARQSSAPQPLNSPLTAQHTVLAPYVSTNHTSVLTRSPYSEFYNFSPHTLSH
jgi:hypothetical protein